MGQGTSAAQGKEQVTPVAPVTFQRFTTTVGGAKEVAVAEGPLLTPRHAGEYFFLRHRTASLAAGPRGQRQSVVVYTPVTDTRARWWSSRLCQGGHRQHEKQIRTSRGSGIRSAVPAQHQHSESRTQ